MIGLVEPNVDNGRSIVIPWTNVAITCGAKVLNACTSVGVFENATEGHEYIIKRHRVSDISG